MVAKGMDRMLIRFSITNDSGSTMGSREEFFAAVKFIGEHEIVPVVDTVLTGLDEAEKGFQLLKRGGQFGKVSFLFFLGDSRPRTCTCQD